MKKVVVAVLAYVLLIAVPSSFADAGHTKADHVKDRTGGMEGAKPPETRHKNGFTQELRSGGVTAKVTYKNPGENKPPVFKVALDSHDINFDIYDFDKIILLRDDAGRQYSPDIMSTSGSGQHRGATIEFKSADIPSAKFIELVLKGVAGVEERVFRFDVKK